MQIIAIVTPSKIPDACGVPPVPGARNGELCLLARLVCILVI